MKEADVRVRIEAALEMLVARDAFLLEHQVGERAIVAKLASYIARRFPDHDVDVEYNREGLDPSDPKELSLGSECRGGGRKRVYPDIVIHRRGHQRHNLLVVEVKREANRESRACDWAKIAAMKRKYGYRFAVLLELPSGFGAAEREVIQKWEPDGEGAVQPAVAADGASRRR